MLTRRQRYYQASRLNDATRQEILDGGVIRLNPALITLTDGLVDHVPARILQQKVWDQVSALLAHKISTYHLDVNYPDYGGFSAQKPDLNTTVFTPGFVQDLTEMLRSGGGNLNLHLLTDFPDLHIADYNRIKLGAVCYQLDTLLEPRRLTDFVDAVLELGACVSPVVETVGTTNRPARPIPEQLETLAPVLAKIGMLTMQSAGTASRSNTAAGRFAAERLQETIRIVRNVFAGTLQAQGGITTRTIGEAVANGAEFLVCGTEIFHHPAGKAPQEVIDEMLIRAAAVLDREQTG